MSVTRIRGRNAADEHSQVLLRSLGPAVAFALAAVCSAADLALETVPSVDLQRYVGRWHQIAYYPNRFQRACTRATTAEYSERSDGTLRVVNTCQTDSGEKRAEGVARVVGPGKLEVRFAPAWLSFLPFVWGDYWIIELASDYSYAVVGAPSRKYLWILARSPALDEATYSGIVERLPARGYDPAKLVRTAP